MSVDPFPPAPDPTAEGEAKWLTEVLLGRPDCDNFRKLEVLRHNVHTRGGHHPPPTAPELTQWANTMSEVLRSIDLTSENLHGFSRSTVRFLDVGSNPGGFTQYILHNTGARGIGITLPVDSGGIGRAFPPHDNFELYELDLTDLVSNYLHSRPLPFNCAPFDTVILDADVSRPRIIVAQLLLGLSVIRNNGQILLSLSCIERPLTARILIALRKIGCITTFKPPQVQTSGVFYLHAQHVRNDTPAYRKIIDNLTRLWNRIHTTDTRDPEWDEQDLITPWEEVMKKSNVGWIVKLGNPLWGSQLTALDRALNRID